MKTYKESRNSMNLFTRGCVTLVAVVTLAFAVSAQGGVVYDGIIYRTGGGAVGIQYDSASVETTVDHIYFTVNTFGTVEIDLLSWEGIAGTDYYLNPAVPTDLNGDGEIAYLDTYIYLFGDDGSLDTTDLVTSNDDAYGVAGLSDGSIRSVDSYLSIVLQAGNYILAIGAFDLDIGEAIAGHNSSSRGTATNLEPYPSVATVYDHGDYRVTFNGDVDIVPEPATICLLGLGGLHAITKRKLQK